MVRFLPLGLGSILCLCACGSVEPGQPAPGGGEGVGRYTLTAMVGEPSDGLVLATGEMTSPTQSSLKADIHATLAMSFMLGGFGQELPFCAKGDGFADVADVPVDSDGCAWNLVSITGNAPVLERSFDGDGYLVRDRSGGLFRLLLVEHQIEETVPGNVGRVTFDVLAVD